MPLVADVPPVVTPPELTEFGPFDVADKNSVAYEGVNFSNGYALWSVLTVNLGECPAGARFALLATKRLALGARTIPGRELGGQTQGADVSIFGARRHGERIDAPIMTPGARDFLLGNGLGAREGEGTRATAPATTITSIIRLRFRTVDQLMHIPYWVSMPR